MTRAGIYHISPAGQSEEKKGIPDGKICHPHCLPMLILGPVCGTKDMCHLQPITPACDSQGPGEDNTEAVLQKRKPLCGITARLTDIVNMVPDTL